MLAALSVVEWKAIYAYLVHRHDLTVGLLDLAELAKEVPEP